MAEDNGQLRARPSGEQEKPSEPPAWIPTGTSQSERALDKRPVEPFGPPDGDRSLFGPDTSLDVSPDDFWNETRRRRRTGDGRARPGGGTPAAEASGSVALPRAERSYPSAGALEVDEDTAARSGISNRTRPERLQSSAIGRADPAAPERLEPPPPGRARRTSEPWEPTRIRPDHDSERPEPAHLRTEAHAAELLEPTRSGRAERSIGKRFEPPGFGPGERRGGEPLERRRTSPPVEHDDHLRRERPYAPRVPLDLTSEVEIEPDEPPPGKREPKGERVEPASQSQTLGQWFKEITILGIVAVGTAVLLTTYVIQAFFIPSASMENTLRQDDRVLVNKLTYKFSEPANGDIVVFKSPDGARATVPPASTPFARFMDKVATAIGLKSSEQDLIKRVIAREGQTIEAKLGLIFVDGRQLDEPYRKSSDPISDFAPLTVPADHVYVLGDNRGDSRDSRSFGPIPNSSIIGKAFARIWPFDRVAWFEF